MEEKDGTSQWTERWWENKRSDSLPEEVKSPALGWKPLWSLWPASQPHVESCPPHPRLVTAGHCSLSQGPCQSCSSNIHTPSPRALLPRSYFLRPWAKVLFWCFCWGLLKWRGRRNLEDPCPPSDSDPGLSPPSPSPASTSGSIKLLEPFTLVSEQWGDPTQAIPLGKME